ncbi:MAG: hypothetical protein R8K49_03255 [Mariprofundaceae bacterium]
MRFYLFVSMFFCSLANAWADVETFEINYLPMHEAKSVVSLQLSNEGSVAVLPSRRLIIVNDDRAHIRIIKKLLQRIDRAATQYMLYMQVEKVSEQQLQQLQASGSMLGGWLKLSAKINSNESHSYQSFRLNLNSQSASMLEVGEFQPYQRSLIRWLEGYGLVAKNSIEMVSLTSGFRAKIRPAGSNQVHLRIQPWIRQASQVSGNSEMLLDLGTTKNPKAPVNPVANLRLNGQPQVNQPDRVNIVSASTELDMPLGQNIVIVAHDGDAKMFGKAILSAHSSSNQQHLLIKLRVEKR